MKNRKFYIRSENNKSYLSPQYDLLGGNAGLPFNSGISGLAAYPSVVVIIEKLDGFERKRLKKR